MRNVGVIIALLVISPLPSFAIQRNPIGRWTHRPLLEVFTATWCPPCELYGHSAVKDMWNEEEYHMWVVVEYHIWGSTAPEGYGVGDIVNRYNVDAIPTYVIDAGYKRIEGAGAEIKSDLTSAIREAAGRDVIKIAIEVTKSVNNGEAEFDVTVRSYEKEQASVRVVGLLVENNIKAKSRVTGRDRIYDHVFRAVSLEEQVTIGAGGSVSFNVKPVRVHYYNPDEVHLVIVVYDEKGDMVNSGSDECTLPEKPDAMEFLRYNSRFSYVCTGSVIKDADAVKEIERTICPLRGIGGKFNTDGDIILVGGPIANKYVDRYNSMFNVSFDILSMKPFRLRISVDGTMFEVSGEDYSVRDYGVVLLAYDEENDINVLIFEGCTRYGTLASVLYALNYPYTLEGYKWALVLWEDINGDGKVDISEIGVLERG